MDEDTYLELLTLVAPLIQKQDTRMRQSISPHERLTATLRFLATGRSYEDLKFSVAISPQALGQIIPETCGAIYSVLKHIYLTVRTQYLLYKLATKLLQYQKRLCSVSVKSEITDFFYYPVRKWHFRPAYKAVKSSLGRQSLFLPPCGTFSPSTAYF